MPKKIKALAPLKGKERDALHRAAAGIDAALMDTDWGTTHQVRAPILMTMLVLGSNFQTPSPLLIGWAMLADLIVTVNGAVGSGHMSPEAADRVLTRIIFVAHNPPPTLDGFIDAATTIRSALPQ